MNKTIFFISTNEIWGGSEELWFQSLLLFKKENWKVFFSCKYLYNLFDNLENIKIPYFQNINSHTLFNKVLILLKLKDLENSSDIFKAQLLKLQPKLVVISQGNNVSCIEIANCCKEMNISYVIVTQLVAEVHFLSINNYNLKKLRTTYFFSKENFFVSQQNLDLNNFMLGVSLKNSSLIFNPGDLLLRKILPFPKSDNYHVALVGRLDCYHKGYDLLFNALKNGNWGYRNIQFNFYGEGPHLDILKSNVKRLKLKNINFIGAYSNLEDVWAANHILLMPSRIEGQPLSLIEAMYSGRSAIATKVGGIPELIQDGESGYLCEANIENITAVLEKAWNNRDRWQEMGENAFRAINKKHPRNEVSFFNQKLKGILVSN